MTNADLIQGFKDLIAFIEANDDFDFAENNGRAITTEIQFSPWWTSDESAVQRDLARRMGSATKTYSGDFIWLDKSFGNGIKFRLAMQRHLICERVVTGTKVVPATQEIVIAAKPAHEEEVVEWRCHPILEEVAHD